ncbi:MAG: class I mannose-6-phosphate isomerase [Victivallales bacterium]|nr:class I mannose-6-phosphate isomerase [Victivallales bacterium]MCF7888974.1 class I mannose-6-phosphate isomerase [Victivallales bacterium]
MQNLNKGNLYPLLFAPIYKEVMWGGNMMKSVLNRELPDSETPIGEAWEIVDREDAVSAVENGSMKGRTLKELIDTYGNDIVGKKCKSERFPLLIKIIDAGKRLSLQVHPGEEECKKITDAEPKTEMWYVISSKKDAKIIAGINHHCTKRMFMSSYSSSEIEKCLQLYKSNPGDAYFINAGTVHALGADNLILEIQQNSNTTYRISDWGRVDSNGKSRELHIDKAMRCIHFTGRTSPKIAGVISKTNHNRKYPIIKYCPYFQVNDLRLVESWNDETDGSSFHIITAVNNEIEITNNTYSTKVGRGRSCLIPSSFGNYRINLTSDTETTVIKTTL